MKNRSVYLCIFLFLLSFTAGCTDTEQRQADSLQEKVMAVHDEAMAEMGTMHELEETLRRLAREQNLPADRRTRYEQTAEQLRLAQASMMQWMRQYKKPEPGTPPEKQQEYLLNQLEKINGVNALTREAVTSGKALTESAATY